MFTRQVNLTLTEEQYRDLEKIAEQKQESKAAVLRQALRLYCLVADKGKTVTVLMENTKQEILL